jgi:endonuclease/exonuclease/phosphatase family metal-dependent hydrolase
MSLLVNQPNYPGRTRASRRVTVLCGLYVAWLLALWALLQQAADDWWPATVLMYMPRWVWAVPLLLLGMAAVWVRPQLFWLLLAGGIVVVWPVMGLCIPWSRLVAEPPAGFRCRVMTCNVHRNPFGVEPAILEANPDIVALQDWPDRHTSRVFVGEKWHVRTAGQFTLASRFPIKEWTVLEPPVAPPDTAVRARLDTPAGIVRFYNLHLATPRQALVSIRQKGWNGAAELQANSAGRRAQSEAIVSWMLADEGPLLAAGDFNTPTDSSIYGDYWSQFTNAFSQAGLGWGYTFHTNRTALRIDHILANKGWHCRDCWVGPPVGSEHRPVIADMEWLGRLK